MGALQLFTQDKDTINRQYEDKLLYTANQSYIFDHFRAGEKPDYDKMVHTLMVKRITDTCNDNLIEWIKDKIAGNLGCSKENKCLRTLIDEYKQCYKKTDCTDTEIICDNIGLVQF